MARPRKPRPQAIVALPSRRLAMSGAVAGMVIAQVTGLVVTLLFRATDGEFNRIVAPVALLAGMALGAAAARVLCGMQGRSVLDPGPRHTYALAAVTIAGLAAGEALRWAIVRPWEGPVALQPYLFVDGAAQAGAAWLVWLILTVGMEPDAGIPGPGGGLED